MRHLIATLLTLFPGLGLGHLILGRWRAFILAFIVGAVAWAVVFLFLVFTLDRFPPFGFKFLYVLPIIAVNLTLAHNLWSERYASTPEETVEEERWYRVQASPFFLKGLAVITIVVLGLFIFDVLTPRHDPTPLEEEEEQIREIEDIMDQHVLSDRVRLIAGGDINAEFQAVREADGDPPVELPFYRYHVTPGDYTLDIYLPRQSEAREIRQLARSLKQPDENFVYMISFHIFVLHTTDEANLDTLISDLSHVEIFHRNINCSSQEIPEICGYAP
jgi:hypothetical protein